MMTSNVTGLFTKEAIGESASETYIADNVIKQSIGMYKQAAVLGYNEQGQLMVGVSDNLDRNLLVVLLEQVKSVLISNLRNDSKQPPEEYVEE